MNKKLDKRNLILFFGILIWYVVKISFYKYVGFPQAITLSNFATIFAFLMFVLCAKDVFDVKRNGYISYVAIGVIISFVISIVYWGASPYRALQSQASGVGLLFIIVFFALRRWRVEKSTVLYVLVTLSVIYLCIWAYSLYKMPEMVFGIDRDDNYGEITARGFYRLFIPGNVSAILSFYFLGVFLNKGKKWGIICALGMLLIVILHVGRQMIVWTILISILMIFVHYRKHFFYVIFAAVWVCLALMYVADKIPAVSAMMEMSKEQGDDYENDIRLEASKHYLFDYPHNPVNAIFGNGTPSKGTELAQLEKNGIVKGYYQTDVGFFAMYCNYGLWAILMFFFLLKRVAKLKVEPDYEFLKYYIYYVYGTYLMSQALTSSIFTVMMAYYVLEKSAMDLKRGNISKYS